jgi:hypothetical protein
MATPVVAGSAAIIRQYFVQGYYPEGIKGASPSHNPSSALVKAIILNSGRRIEAVRQKNGLLTRTTPFDESQGFGRLTLKASLPLRDKNKLKAIFLDRTPIFQGEVHTYQITSNRRQGCNEPLSATLVWTDPPVIGSCRNCVLNDLDLTIIRDGSTVYPNGRRFPDTKNNAERVRFNHPPDGGYIVQVKGKNLESSSQKYALVITGCLEGQGGIAPDPKSR